MRTWLVGGLLLGLTACPRQTEPAADGTALLSQARSALAERERKLQTYRFHGQTTDLQRQETLGFNFVYRAPTKMRGETLGASAHVFVFDGSSLRELDVAAKKVTTYDLTGLPRDRSDALLHQIFAPFAPEGFRAPLLPAGSAVKAERRIGAEEKAEVMLTTEVADGAEHYAFIYRYRTPAMDLVEKIIRAPDGDHSTVVNKQSCEPKSGLCVPTEIVETAAGKPVARTVLSEVAINGPVTDGDFVLAVPAGGTEEKKSLAAAP
jgi:hypothetical protein